MLQRRTCRFCCGSRIDRGTFSRVPRVFPFSPCLYFYSVCCLLVIVVVPEPVAGDVVEGKTGDPVASAARYDPSKLEALQARIQSLEKENMLLRRSKTRCACCVPDPDSDPDVECDPLHHHHWFPACHACLCFMQEATEVISELCGRLGFPMVSVDTSTAPLSGTDSKASSRGPHVAVHDSLLRHDVAALHRALQHARKCLSAETAASSCTSMDKGLEAETPEQAAVRGLMLKGYEFHMRKRYRLQCCRSCVLVPLHLVRCRIALVLAERDHG
jgi:hypothetical protein